MKVTPKYHAMSTDEVIQSLEVDPTRGLTRNEISDRQRRFGFNTIGQSRSVSLSKIFLNQFKSLLTALLVGAAILSFIFEDVSEAVAILIVIIINISIGFWAESKAQRSMAALRKIGRATTKVRRDGVVFTIADEDLVPGDIILLEAGDIVTADIRILQSSNLQSDESLLTGESVPIDKNADTLAASRQLHECSNMTFKGTTITRGACTGIAVSTGRKTALGDIALLAETSTSSASPLEIRLKKLSEQLLLAVLLLTLLVSLSGIVMGRDLVLMVKTGIAMAVAAIPEGLPIVATLALARGMWKLAEQHALIERLSAVETLGSVNIIFTDKTGTLTQNRMTATMLFIPEAPQKNSLATVSKGRKRALRVCALCYSGDDPAQLSDPMERALIEACEKVNLLPLACEDQFPRIGQQDFDPNVRMMATIHQYSDQYLYAVKGAPEAILNASSCVALAGGDEALTPEQRDYWLAHIADLAKNGLRVLALAERVSEKLDENYFEGLTFLGLIGLEDPPRSDAASAVKSAQEAGVRVIMVTGDNAITGVAIAQAVGITDAHKYKAIEGSMLDLQKPLSQAMEERVLTTSVFARMAPAQKLFLINLYQDRGEVVAMTGDGVNDAPALKKADVGIAMGIKGTEVAKEAADMILKDDSFASIVQAIQQGRIIFTNIRKFVLYLLSCNLSEVLVVTICILAGMPLPLMPLQILFLNLITDVFPALALGFGKGDEDIIKQLPRQKSEGIITRRHWHAIIGYSLLMTSAVIGAFIWALAQDAEQGYANSIAFLTLAFAQLWHVFNMRGANTTLLNNQVVRNPFIWAALALCFVLITMALCYPPVASVLQIISPDIKGWGVVMIASFLPLIACQFLKFAASYKPR